GGCASVPLGDGGGIAASVRDRVGARHLSPRPYDVQPLNPWDPDGVVGSQRAPMPPLLRGYLRLGAWVCGEPAHDPDFDCADFMVLLGMDHVDDRYLRFFLGDGAE
ncbi:MAG TPA: GNAT family N-acetyltransferase, partial [Pseudonocardia sp.]